RMTRDDQKNSKSKRTILRRARDSRQEPKPSRAQQQTSGRTHPPRLTYDSQNGVHVSKASQQAWSRTNHSRFTPDDSRKESHASTTRKQTSSRTSSFTTHHSPLTILTRLSFYER
ncbi:MAG TPA: hypothetical protein VFT90_16655, partial [Chryseosolibacter sp.]|nr:hypothetical protein [Chryseosolibacter sp.]